MTQEEWMQCLDELAAPESNIKASPQLMAFFRSVPGRCVEYVERPVGGTKIGRFVWSGLTREQTTFLDRYSKGLVLFGERHKPSPTVLAETYRWMDQPR